MTVLTWGAAAVTTAALWWGAPWGAGRVSRRRLVERCAHLGAVALSYDDGPGRALTPRLLETLHQANARATFFPLGMRAAGCEKILDEAAARGHEIGCHGQSHPHAWRVAPWRPALDARGGFRTLRRWVPADGLFRPPHGKLDLATCWALWRKGARPAWWTLDSGDTWPVMPPPETVARSLVSSGGGVLLLHDFDRGAHRSAYVLEVTRQVLTVSRASGLRVLTLGELMSEAS